MKLIFTYALLLTLTFPWLMKVAVSIDFVIHQDYIAKNLCENRDKPELQCDGTCVFMEKLKLNDTEPEKSKMPVEVIAFELSSFLLCPRFTTTAKLIPVKSSHPVPASCNLYSDPFPEEIFHPPCLFKV